MSSNIEFTNFTQILLTKILPGICYYSRNTSPLHTPDLASTNGRPCTRGQLLTRFLQTTQLNGRETDIVKKFESKTNIEHESHVIDKFKDHLHFNHQLKEHNVLPQSLHFNPPIKTKEGYHIATKVGLMYLRLRIMNCHTIIRQHSEVLLDVSSKL